MHQQKADSHKIVPDCEASMQVFPTAGLPQVGVSRHAVLGGQHGHELARQRLCSAGRWGSVASTRAERHEVKKSDHCLEADSTTSSLDMAIWHCLRL